ncbi:MAG: DUF4197 domain-containing protein [Flavobacteriales bacterium]
MKKLGLFVLLISLVACTPADLQSILNAPTSVLSNDEVISGLKEALRIGTERSVEKATGSDGFLSNPLIRIPFPQEAIKVKNTLLDIGLNKPVDDFELALNKAAVEASKEAVPVFVDAITSMSIQDGFNLLKGGENAATNFLREKTTAALTAKFAPVVHSATQTVDLTSYWTPLATTYNTTTLLTGGNAIDPDLDAYITTKAIDGLFLLLADEEKKIREDPLARTTSLLQKVFAQQ